MTESNNWGGPRPKVRPDDNRGGARAGAGRPQETKKIKVGDSFAAKRHLADGGQLLTEIWTISEVDRNSITIETRDGDTIILVR